MITEKNRERLREAATSLIQAVEKDEKKATAIQKYVDLISQQVVQMLYQQQQQVNVMMFMQPQKSEYNEKVRVAIRLSGFNPKDNYVINEINKRFGPNIKHGELVAIAQAIAEKAQIKLDRDAKRRKNVLLKWFHENWDTISPFLDYIVLEDMNPGSGKQSSRDVSKSSSMEDLHEEHSTVSSTPM